jgi:hypothetical protein
VKIIITAAAIAVAWFAGHGTIGLIIVLAYCWATAMASAGGTAKSRSTENRLNTAMPRIPWPQANPGQYGNTSFGPSNISYTVGNGSFDLSSNTNNIGAADNGGLTSGQIGGAAAHHHDMSHGHYYGNSAGDFNALRDTVSTLIPSFNTHISDHGALVNTVSTLRSDHSNLLNAHNDLITRLGNSKILV